MVFQSFLEMYFVYAQGFQGAFAVIMPNVITEYFCNFSFQFVLETGILIRSPSAYKALVRRNWVFWLNKKWFCAYCIWTRNDTLPCVCTIMWTAICVTIKTSICRCVLLYEHRSHKGARRLLHSLKHPAYLAFPHLPLLSYHEKHLIPTVTLIELSH